MTKTTQRRIAVLLIWLQLFVLLTAAAPHAFALERAAETPVRNAVREGVLRFGSFGFNGDTEHGRDGIDYVAAYYYSDDFFAPSAVNPNATRKVMEWRDLENPSMATLSKAFALAVCSTSENTVPVDWTHKSKNGEQFFADNGFSNVYISPDFNQQTGRDTLGYMIASKPITVWDARTQSNRSFTLIAIGIRGGGYGAEWASNLTIGDSDGPAGSDKSLAGTYRHKGFSDGKDMVLADLDAYLAKNRITGDVKYWVTGYSRSGAVANLTAGALTDQAKKYHTSMEDIYTYTYEAAAGALASEDPDGTRYPNIHNILNPMDLVPRISPKQFGHARLGVDYRLPFYQNTTAEENTAYYTRMRTVLPEVAAIADIYNANYTGNEDDKTEDSVITDSDPEKYPYNRPIEIKSFKIANLLSGGFTQPVSNAASVIAPDEGLMYDQFLDQFLDRFVCSRAWDAAYLKRDGLGWSSENMTFDPLSHEFQYVRVYQRGLRSIAGALFKQPGKGLNSLGGAMDNITSALDLEALWNASGLAAHYALLNLGTRYNYHVHEMIEPAVTLVNKIVDASGIFLPEDLNEVHAAVRIVMPALIWLYCEDHTRNNGEYLGTLMDNFSTIFVTHIPEMTISWLMSLDERYTCDYREITVPKATEIHVLEFREQYGETLSASGGASAIAVVKNGALSACIDDRVTVSAGKDRDDTGAVIDTVTIRFPGDMDLRFDVRPLQGVQFADMLVRAQDYAPYEVVNTHAVCRRDERGHIVSDGIERLLTPDTTPSAQKLNAEAARTAYAVTDRDTLRILAFHGSNQIAHPTDGTYAVTVDTVPANRVQFWRDPTPALRAKLEALFAGLPDW